MYLRAVKAQGLLVENVFFFINLLNFIYIYRERGEREFSVLWTHLVPYKGSITVVFHGHLFELWIAN